MHFIHFEAKPTEKCDFIKYAWSKNSLSCLMHVNVTMYFHVTIILSIHFAHNFWAGALQEYRTI